MSVRFNHTLVHATDTKRSAEFMTQILGLPAPTAWGPFQVVQLANGTSLDFIDAGGTKFDMQHYAFQVDESEFDEIFGRIKERGLPYWADPFKNKPGEINHHDGGRGVYWDDPDGHKLEIITRPYGSGER